MSVLGETSFNPIAFGAGIQLGRGAHAGAGQQFLFGLHELHTGNPSLRRGVAAQSNHCGGGPAARLRSCRGRPSTRAGGGTITALLVLSRQ